MRNPLAFAADRAEEQRRRPARRSSSWAGASTSRLYADWEAWTISPDFEVRHYFRLLRARARDLARNNPWIGGFVDELANNVVGQAGIMLQAQIKDRTGTTNKIVNRAIEQAFVEWGMPENASADGHDSWIELQRLIIQTIATDGECLIRRIRGADNDFGYTLQLIDVDLLDETYNIAASSTQNLIKMGVEVDKRNRPLAYWIWSRYGEDGTGEPRVRQRVPAEDVIHLFVRYRPNQTRGITWFAPILTKTQHLDGYELNELVATRAAAGKMGFIVNKQPEAIAAFEWKDGQEPKTMDVEPGTIDELLPGQEFQSFDPSHPSGQYESFTSNVLRAVARGLRISYLTLTGDLRQANFSSMRAGLLPERDRWRGLQVWMATHCNRPVYRDWIDMSALKRAIVELPTLLGSDYYGVQFKGRGWKWVDPQKEIQAAQMEVDLGINSRQRLAADQGRDFEEIIDERRDEEAYAKEQGVVLSQGIPTIQRVPDSGDDAGHSGSENDNGNGAGNNEQRPEDRGPNATEVAVQGMESAMRIVEAQAKSLGAAANRPIIAPSVHVAAPEVSVEVTNEARPGTKKKSTSVRQSDGSLVTETEEVAA